MAEFPIMIAAAFVFGFGARLLRLPPLAGFLVAGFVLSALGFASSPELDRVSDLGITLLLFSIGLKLRLGHLLRPAVWAGTTLYMAVAAAVLGVLFYVLGFGILGELDLRTAALIAFAASFSSTVFAVKIFDEQGRSASFPARTTIGILIMQDIIAVIFLAASKGTMPSPWALALLLLIPARRLLKRLMEWCGHGELLLLLGILMTIGGSWLFEVVQMKGDLGALIFGMLVADHPKAKEMARTLLGFKDLFLVGFFLSIGLIGLPAVTDLGIVLFLVALLPFKVALYFGILTLFNLRARTATMASLSLANFSEFGLVVGALGAKMGWLSDQWLLILAVSVAVSFIAASPVSGAAHRIYDRFRPLLTRFERARRVPQEAPVHLCDAEVVIFGMGHVGAVAYDSLREEYGDRLLAVDFDPDTVRTQVEAGRNVIRGDPTDSDFWDRVVAEGTPIKVAMLALPNHRANLAAAAEIREAKKVCALVVTATAKYDDEVRELEENGVDAAFNLYAEAGLGYVDLVRSVLQSRQSE